MGIEGGRESQILAENKILKQRKREKRKIARLIVGRKRETRARVKRMAGRQTEAEKETSLV